MAPAAADDNLDRLLYIIFKAAQLHPLPNDIVQNIRG
jgi:hypothetical protein